MSKACAQTTPHGAGKPAIQIYGLRMRDEEKRKGIGVFLVLHPLAGNTDWAEH